MKHIKFSHSSLVAMSVALCAALSSFGGDRPAKFVEYIETSGSGASGTQWLRLDCKPSSTATIEFEAALRKKVTQTFFCARSDLKKNTLSMFWIENSGLRWDYANAGGSKYAAKDQATETPFTVKVSGGEFFYNGVKDANLSFATSTFTAGGRLMLFASYATDDSEPTGNYAAIRLYSFKVTDGGETVCDLRPCVDGDGVAGLYDTVSRNILYSMGTDAFAASETEVPWPPFVDDTLTVTAVPVEHRGALGPAYGTTPVEAGAVRCEAPADWVEAEDGCARGKVGGWTLVSFDADLTETRNTSGTGAVCAYDHVAGEFDKLVWQWDMEYALSVAEAEGGTVTGETGWFAEGAEVTLTAVPDPDYGFRFWSGEGASRLTAAQRESPVITVAITGPMALRPVFGTTYYVSPSGSNDADGSEATPFKTLTYAVSKANEGDEIVMLDGTYPNNSATVVGEVAPIVIDKPLTVRSANGRGKVTLKCQIAILSDGAVVRGITVNGAQASGTYANGGGVYMEAGRLEASAVVSCKAGDGGGIRLNGGTVSRCYITQNTAGVRSSGYGIYIKGASAVLEHSLVYANSGQQKSGQSNCYGGGIYLAKGIVRNCTVTDNKGCAQGGGLYASGGAVIDSIFYGNNAPDTASSSRWMNIDVSIDKNAVAVTNCCVKLASTGETIGTIVGDYPLALGSDEDPGFADYTAKDFSLRSNSRCVNAAFGEPTVELDYAGNPRVSGGVMDVGCYEADISVATVNIDSYEAEGTFGSNYVTFAASCIGGTLDEAKSWWTFDGRPASAEDHDATGICPRVFLAPGVYTVAFAAEVGGAVLSTVSESDWFTIYSPRLFVRKTNENAREPYDTWDIAATSLSAALRLATDGTVVTVTNGTHSLSKPETLDHGITIRSVEGRGQTTLAAVNREQMFILKHPDAVVEGFTLSGQKASSGESGGAVRIASGRLVDCTISNARAERAYGGGVYLSSSSETPDAVMSNCTVTACKNQTITVNARYGDGIGVYATGTGALVANCRIEKCIPDGGNGTNDSFGVLFVGGGATARNCLVTGSEAPCYSVYLSGASTLENSTVVGNTAVNKTSGGAHGGIWCADSARVVNCIIRDNGSLNPGLADETTQCFGTTANFDHDCAAGAEGEGSFDADPLFRNAAEGDFRVKASSRCVDAGVHFGWMDGALDLMGKPRVFSVAPDIGCYECQSAGMAIIVR